jgi:LAO/AO transport system kinase
VVTTAKLLEDLKARKPPALARAISLVENGSKGFESMLAQLHSKIGGARRIGITGPPGSGKSTLIERLAAGYRRAGRTVGVVAVDPSSPFTGGALLGDRIRMERAATDPGVFIRSMASRGSLGGMATTTGEVADVMDAYGFDRILVETVGVGQSELDVVSVADTTVVVLVPESGDGIQVMKAGLMEIADIFVVNKADRPGADRLRQELEIAAGLRRGEVFRHVPAHHLELVASSKTARGKGGPGPASGAGDDMVWEPPVIATVAARDEGVDDVGLALDRHFSFLESSGGLAARRAHRLELRTREVLNRALYRWIWSDSGPKAELAAALADVIAGKRSPYEAAAGIVDRLRGGKPHERV